ncbi:hypothetical protein CLV24_12061 [Pontibacter ummariensis]|uniref:Uncharacterized protein n=1 Tax=Pontibacter ummariensis TaxID=1610492 RepID=A0A239J5M7_9BACT|nr:hypothetical protein [Pontibacter ummariensis]PRY08893.1 hypothetical protein CLV24_12061 [Pontibacter ummariensis]SNT01157.1 hypothetical protein SAMN06296052_12060 [Pontibacter ummariensis]
MELKYTRPFLNKLEDIFAESDFVLRYEKGNFKAGYCVLKDMRVAVVNKYYSLEGKINCLYDILRSIAVNEEQLSEKSRQLYQQICNQEKVN